MINKVAKTSKGVDIEKEITAAPVKKRKDKSNKKRMNLVKLQMICKKKEKKNHQNKMKMSMMRMVVHDKSENEQVKMIVHEMAQKYVIQRNDTFLCRNDSPNLKNNSWCTFLCQEKIFL